MHTLIQESNECFIGLIRKWIEKRAQNGTKNGQRNTNETNISIIFGNCKWFTKSIPDDSSILLFFGALIVGCCCCTVVFFSSLSIDSYSFFSALSLRFNLVFMGFFHAYVAHIDRYKNPNSQIHQIATNRYYIVCLVGRFKIFSKQILV